MCMCLLVHTTVFVELREQPWELLLSLDSVVMGSNSDAKLGSKHFYLPNYLASSLINLSPYLSYMGVFCLCLSFYFFGCFIPFSLPL